MGLLSDADIAAAEARGQAMAAVESRAVSARYDAGSGRVTVELANGCAYIFPANLVQELQGRSADELARVEVDGAGFNLHWPALNADLYVPSLVAGVFGTREWMVTALARRAGKATSAAKAAAARRNGAKGGRPRKQA